MEKEKKAKKNSNLAERLYDILYLEKKYQLAQFKLLSLLEQLEVGKHYKHVDGRVKYTQVGLMRMGRIIKKTPPDMLPDDPNGPIIVEAEMINECINQRMIECSVDGKRVAVTVNPLIKRSYRRGKKLLIEKMADDLYTAPPRVNTMG